MDLTRNAMWLDDISFLSTELQLKHKNLFFHRKKEDFLNDIAFLKANIEIFSDYEVKLKIAKLVATIRDAHTSLALQINLLLPLEFYWFPDGIYVTVAASKYNDIMYCKIIKINGIAIKKVINDLKSIISYENETYLKSQLPKYLPAIELLYDLDLACNVDYVELTFEDENNKIRTLEIESLSLKESMQKLSLIKNDLGYLKTLPLCRKNGDNYYWFKYLDIPKVVYFKYNVCRDMLSCDVYVFCKKLIKFIEEHVVDKLIIDMRNNFGGNSSLLDPFIEDIKHSLKINKKGNLFVIIGRETFSSAVINCFSLKKNTAAIFVGEPTGGKPNCYGELQRLTLKNCGLTICYSTKYFKLTEDDSLDSFLPDFPVFITLQNYINKVDPCFEYIINKY